MLLRTFWGLMRCTGCVRTSSTTTSTPPSQPTAPLLLPNNGVIHYDPAEAQPLPAIELELSDAYQLAESGELLSQGRCIDALLDCLNASTREAVRLGINDALRSFAKLNMVRSKDFRTALDRIQLVLRADRVFDQDTVLLARDIL